MPRVFRADLALLDAALAVVFQPDCVVCGASCPGTFCEGCLTLSLVEAPLCERCGMSITQAMRRCGRCLASHSVILKARSLLWYETATAAVVQRIKFAGRYELLALFRPAMVRFTAVFPPEVVVVPVPLHPSRLRQRGFNQTEIVSEWVCKQGGFGRPVTGLLKLRSTPAQSKLSRFERQTNLRGSFGWQRTLAVPKQVLLVDDIYTTGATLEACARVLKRAGCREVYAWTLFRTPRR